MKDSNRKWRNEVKKEDREEEKKDRSYEGMKCTVKDRKKGKVEKIKAKKD